MDKAAFKTAFRGARRFVFGADTFFITRKDEWHGHPVSDTFTTLMIGVVSNDQMFFQFVDEKGQWPQYDGDWNRLIGLPKILRVANSPAGPVFRLTIETRDIGGNTNTPVSQKLIVALRPQPLIVGSVRCTSGGGGGACTAYDSAIYPRVALQCDWSRTLGDYLCTSTRAWSDLHWMTHPAERRFTLIAGKALPVAKPGMRSFRSLQEFRTWMQTSEDVSRQRVIVDGIGVLAPIEEEGGTRLYAAPGLHDDMELRLFAFPKTGDPEQVPLHKIVDGHEAEDTPATVAMEEFTPIGEEWTVSPGYSFSIGRLSIVPIVLHDSRGRGLFWLAEDWSNTPPKMSLLRVASDVGPYDHCKQFIYPASASAVTIANGRADLTIEPHSRRDEEGKAFDWGEGDPPPCHVRGELTWDHDKGFLLMLTDIPCQPNEARVGVAIDAFGHLSAAPLRYAPPRYVKR
ncbi:MAG: hypothetical protein JO093_11835 [Acidobacteria bacterium]|nr:hypothetical protein [Acidobacteriota bacterium]MBV9070133.1 hypothetical protein [Acidobacteriota bacterium]MBV9186308.1 hypothetical protein [Acidobacteriota bacterium]